jgi:hypothetical protein
MGAVEGPPRWRRPGQAGAGAFGARNISVGFLAELPSASKETPAFGRESYQSPELVRKGGYWRSFDCTSVA